jgi:hypothetical protein
LSLLDTKGDSDNKMDQLCTTDPAASAPRRWWHRIVKKPPGEIALDLLLFVLGVLALYAIDLTFFRHFAPLAIQDMIDLILYLNHHAVAAVQMLS